MEVENLIYTVRGIQVMLDSDLVKDIRTQNVTLDNKNLIDTNRKVDSSTQKVDTSERKVDTSKESTNKQYDKTRKVDTSERKVDTSKPTTRLSRAEIEKKFPFTHNHPEQAYKTNEEYAEKL